MTTPTHAEDARTLLALGTTGSLGTCATEPAGHPFVSLVAYALDADGDPLLALSSLAEHSQNLAADARASLLVLEATDGDPQAAGRVTALGTCAPAPDQDAARETFLAAHPDATYATFGDFTMMRLAIVSLRVVAGFGRMSWVSADEYRAAEPDPVASIEQRIIRHMRAEHLDALLEIVQAFGGIPEGTAADMAGVDRYGVEATVETPAGQKLVRIPFDEPVTEGGQVREFLTQMTHDARAKLGID